MSTAVTTPPPAAAVLDCAATAFAWDYLKQFHHGSLTIGLAGDSPRPGVRAINVTFQDGCGTMAFNPEEAQRGVRVLATVVNVTDMGNVAGASAFSSLWLSNCDRSSQLNVTAPGVYVVTGTLATVIAERQPMAGADNSSCVGKGRISYEASSLDDYCRVDATRLVECAKGPPATVPAPPTPAASAAYRRSTKTVAAAFVLALTVSLGLTV